MDSLKGTVAQDWCILRNINTYSMLLHEKLS